MYNAGVKHTAVLLITCPDRKGIVAAVSQFLYKYNANILHADEHQDAEENLFFLRTEWDLKDFALTKAAFDRAFLATAKAFTMQWKVVYTQEEPKVAIFVSKEDHCLADLLYRYRNNELACTISMIVSNHPKAKDLAAFYGIPFHEVKIDKKDKATGELQILKLVKSQKIDLIILARYMQILSSDFLKEFGKPIINIHHSFLPSFIGAKPYHQAYERGVKIIGATAHYVTAELDQGPIIEQDTLRVSHRDDVQNLIQKGKDIEKIVLSRATKWHIENRILTYGNKTVVFD